MKTADRMLRGIIALMLIISTACMSTSCIFEGRAIGMEDTKSMTSLPSEKPNEEFINAYNDFAIKLLNAYDDDAFVFSPLSIAMTLQMASYGADKKALTAINKTVALTDLTLEPNDIHTQNARILNVFNALAGVDLLNSLIVDKSTPLADDFIECAINNYRAGVGEYDFAHKQTVIDAVNAWASESTDGRIIKLMDDMSPTARLIILNALNFEGKWRIEFNSKNNYKADFNGVHSTGTAEYMTLNASLEYASNDFGQVALMPYAGNELFMALYLPNKDVKPVDMLNNTSFDFSDCIKISCTVSMPKIDITTNSDMLASLEDMGLTDATLGGLGNLDGLFKNPDTQSYIGAVYHAARLKVYEGGTMASASTALEIDTKSAPSSYSLICNRPYAMAVIHRDTGLVLFLSVVNDLG